MASNPSVPDTSLVSPDRVRSVVQATLRAAQAEGWSDPQLEQLSGVPARTIKSYRVEGKEPSLSNALSLAVVIGPKALNPLLALIGYVGRPLDEAGGFNPNLAVASSLQHFSTIALCAADGRIDHQEAPRCREAADMIIQTIMPLSSAAEAE